MPKDTKKENKHYIKVFVTKEQHSAMEAAADKEGKKLTDFAHERIFDEKGNVRNTMQPSKQGKETSSSSKEDKKLIASLRAELNQIKQAFDELKKKSVGYNRKYGDDVRAAVVEEKNQGMTLMKIAVKHDMSLSTVQNIIREHKREEELARLLSEKD